MALLALSATPVANGTDTIVQHVDAFVTVDPSSGEWTIGNAVVRYSVIVGKERTVSLGGLSLGEDEGPVTVSDEPDAVITVGGRATRLGALESGFTVEAVTPSEGSHFVALAIRFVNAARTLRAIRNYIVYPGTEAVEMWTDFESLDGVRHTVANLNAYSFAVPPGDIDYILGLDTSPSDGGAFTRRTRQLAPGERLALGSATLSSEATIPYFSIGNGHRRVFGGLLWSGGWSAALDRTGDAVHLAFGLPDMSAWVKPERSVEGPHAFIGATWDTPGADVAAVTRFVRAGRAGRGFPALTTFNTWFVRGINIDEETIRRDMDWASEVGLELFQLDAGWYPREDAQHAFDFTPGLGTWEVDAARFSRGLFDLGEYARARGLQFGIWVEPERVAMETVGRPDLAEVRYLALQDGRFDPGVPNDEARDAQICLAEPAARAWVMRHLTQFLDQVRPDNLKWDFNRWVHCNRADHDHPADGGNYEHTRALYEILAAIRQRYPALTIENCAQGGHRMDFAMTRLTDTAWMDDRSAPAGHVRRNLQGLMSILPVAYLFSYLMPHPDEPIRGGDDLPLLARSRMPGVFGVAEELALMSENELDQIHQEVELAKALRGFQSDAITYPLTPQRPGSGEWEVVQQFSPSTGTSLIFAFENEASHGIVVSLRGIQPDVTYELRSSDHGPLGRLNGADLIARGLLITDAQESDAQVLVLEPIITSAWRPQQRLFDSTSGFRTTPASSSRR